MALHRVAWVAVLLCLGLALSATPVLAGPTLVLNGKTASTDVRTINGSAYVRLADVATRTGE